MLMRISSYIFDILLKTAFIWSYWGAVFFVASAAILGCKFGTKDELERDGERGRMKERPQERHKLI